jgi:hypothetical protein
MSVSTKAAAPKLSVHRPFGPEPVKEVCWILPLIDVPEFSSRKPVIDAEVHLIKVFSLAVSLILVSPMFVAVMLTPVASHVPVGCVTSGEAEAAAGMTEAARATKAIQAVMSFLLMRYFLP